MGEGASFGQQEGCSALPGAGVRAVSRGPLPGRSLWAGGDTGLLGGIPPSSPGARLQLSTLRCDVEAVV